jgi:hypothetical protein
MATEKDNTLQIKDFRGISRFNASPNQDPNKLYTVQNMYSPARGELKNIPYKQSLLTDAGQDFSTKIGFIRYIDRINTPLGAENLILGITVPSLASLPVPVGGTTSATAPAINTSGTSLGVDTNFRISYLVNGIESGASAAVNCFQGTTGFKLDLPATFGTDHPNISGISVYIGVTAADYVWMATVLRSGSSFATSTIIKANLPITTTSSTIEDIPSVFTITSAGAGSLIGGMTYYFAWAPAVRKHYVADDDGLTLMPKASNTISGNIIAYTLPINDTSISVSLTVSGKYDGTNSYTSGLLLMGTSSEDLIVVEDNTSLHRITQGLAFNAGSATTFTIKAFPKGHNTGTAALPDSTRRQLYVSLRHPLYWRDTAPGTMGLMVFDGANIASGFDYTLYTWWWAYPIKGNPVIGMSGYITLGGATKYDVAIANNLVSTGYVSDTLSGQIAERLYFQNGFQRLFYTNGYVVQQVSQSNQESGGSFTADSRADPPLCSFITVFKGRLICGGGPTNLYNTHGLAYYSAIDSDGGSDPFNWSATNSIVRQFINVQTLGAGEITGLGVYSIDGTNVGPQAQLVIGKYKSVLMTVDVTTSPQEVLRGDGTIGPRCFVNTNVGFFFLGGENFYELSGSGIAVPVGNDVSTIIKQIFHSFDSIRSFPSLSFIDGHIKIIYNNDTDPTAHPEDLLRTLELFCDIQRDQQTGERRFVWTGPHVVDGLYVANQLVVNGGSSALFQPSSGQLRIGRNRTALLNLETSRTSTISPYTASPVYKIITNDMYLNADHFMKIITRLHVTMRAALKAGSNLSTSIAITLDVTDQAREGSTGGTGAMTQYTDSVSFTINPASSTDQLDSIDGTFYKNIEKIFSSRYRGRIVRMTLIFPSNNCHFSIYDISLIFKPERRRTM